MRKAVKKLLRNMETEKILITVITVCKNAEKYIGATLKSVISQTYSNIEYIIIDGASTDNTMDIVEKIAKEFPIIYQSEADNGIYDAMNKGITLATGDYIHFLNAGDTFAENDTLCKVVEEIGKRAADIYYGNIIYQYPNGESRIRTYGSACGKKIYYCTGDCINHQAIFASGKYLKKAPFDNSYKICGDRDWMMRMHKMKALFQNMPLTICNYSLDGNSVSLSNEELGHREAERCIREHFPMQYGIFRLFEACRKNRALARMLHGIYKLLYIRKQ